MVRTQLYCHKVIHMLYNYMFQPWVLWPSSGCSQLIDQLYNIRRVYSGGGDGDEISSYNVEGHGLVMFLTSVEISIVQVGVLLRLCFWTSYNLRSLRRNTGGTDRLLWQAGNILTILHLLFLLYCCSVGNVCKIQDMDFATFLFKT